MTDTGSSARADAMVAVDRRSVVMVRSAGLILIGYWDGPSTCPGWPSVKEFVDAGWDAEERELVADYLRTGLVARRCMGYSPCRFCGRNNGCLELTDGHFVWPDGLPHYVTDHDVRLPVCFVQHVLKMTDRLETAQRGVLGVSWTAAKNPSLFEHARKKSVLVSASKHRGLFTTASHWVLTRGPLFLTPMNKPQGVLLFLTPP